jgi:hypothetical protein
MFAVRERFRLPAHAAGSDERGNRFRVAGLESRFIRSRRGFQSRVENRCVDVLFRDGDTNSPVGLR